MISEEAATERYREILSEGLLVFSFTEGVGCLQ